LSPGRFISRPLCGFGLVRAPEVVAHDDAEDDGAVAFVSRPATTPFVRNLERAGADVNDDIGCGLAAAIFLVRPSFPKRSRSH